MSARPALTLEGDGVWSARVYLGTAPDGRRIRPYRRFPGASTEAEARAAADAWAADLTADGRVRSVILRDVLDDHIAALERSGASPHTVRTYRLYARRYVGPRMGGRMATAVTPVDVDALLADLLERGGEGGAPLSSATVRGVREMLSGVYTRLERLGVATSNPARDAAPLRPEVPESSVLSPADVAALDAEVRRAKGSADPAERCGARATWLALRTGLRVGEVCALRGRDLRRPTHEVHVGGTVVEIGTPFRKPRPKSDGSVRNVPMEPSDFEEALTWSRGPSAPLLSVDGRWTRPSTVSAWFRAARDRLGLDPRLTFHSLRHTFVTTLLTRGADIKTVSDMIGHADEAITLRIYGHVVPGRGAELAAMAADAYDDMARSYETR